MNDIEESENLNKVLSSKYPHLKYKIITFLSCGKCFDSRKLYTCNSDKIELYNIASPQADELLFENCARKVFNV